MICNSCGRVSSNENANFCDYCGASLKEAVYIHHNVEARELSEEKKESKEDVSFGNWIGTLLLPVIPIIGPLVYLVLMLVWAFSKDTNKSKKNWARASLIVGFVFTVIFIFMLVQAIVDLSSMGFDWNGYTEQMNQFY